MSSFVLVFCLTANQFGYCTNMKRTQHEDRPACIAALETAKKRAHAFAFCRPGQLRT